MKALFPAIFIILYPIVTHTAILFKVPDFALIYFAGVLILFIFDNQLSYFLKTVFSVLVLVIIVYAFYHNNITILYLSPIFISLSLFWTFSRSLVAPRRPLITVLASAIYQREMPEEMVAYTRKCTIFWAAITGFMTLETILLALFAPIEIWSLFCNILNYIFLALCLLLEYLYRIYRFGRKMTLKEYIQGLSKINWRNLLRNQT